MLYRKIVFIFIFFVISVHGQETANFNNLRKNFRITLSKEIIDSAKYYLHQMEVLAKSSRSDSLFMVSRDQYALYNFLHGDYEQSITYLIIASDIALQNNYLDIYLDMLNNLGTIFAKINEYDKAKEMYTKVLRLSDSSKVNSDYLATLSNLGSAYQNLGKIDSANVIIEKGLELSKKYNFKENTASLLKFAAKNKLLSKEYYEVIKLVNEIVTKYDTIISPRMLDDAYFYRAQANLELNKISSAEKDVNSAINLMGVQKNDPALVERLLFYSKLKEAQKDFKAALEIQNQVIRVKDSFDEVSMRQNVLEIEKKYQTEKKEKENLQLKEEAYKKDILLSKSRNDILIVIVFFIFILVVIVFYYLNSYKQKNKELNTSIDKRIKLEKKLNTVRENIAQDFHDDLGNKLASITVLTDILSNKIANDDEQKIVQKIQENSDSLYKGTKDFIWTLNKNSDYLEEVITYLSDFGEDFFHKMDISFKIKKSIDSNIILPYYWSRHIILIFKEAITNVAKHASATDCEIQFIHENNLLKILLIDNGKGFDINEIKNPNGLENMQKRVAIIEGDIQIYSNKTGTVIAFSAKLPKEGS